MLAQSNQIRGVGTLDHSRGQVRIVNQFYGGWRALQVDLGGVALRWVALHFCKEVEVGS